MANSVVPMIHVPDVRATVEWYQAIGFTVEETYGDGFGGLSFAIVSFGRGQVMFNQDGQRSSRSRREVDLYVQSEDVDGIYRDLKDRVEVVEGPHETFYGMREFIIRDLNRFWITFGQVSVSELLMDGVRRGDAQAVRVALDDGTLTPDVLAAALDAASVGSHRSAEIVEMLKMAGAVPPPRVDAETLQAYVGEYSGEDGIKVGVTFMDGTLFLALAGQPPQRLLAVNATSFRSIGFAGGTVTFSIEAAKTTGLLFTQGPDTTPLRRMENAGDRSRLGTEPEHPPKLFRRD